VKPVIEKLCMAISILALNTTHTCWPNSITDLLDFGFNHGPIECFVALNILKNISYTFQSTVFD
jgi:hypothetical protein